MNEREYSQAIKAISWLEANQEAVCQLWVKQYCIAIVFRQHQIDSEFFARHFAVRVVRYFIGVVKGEERIGECPAIMVMLEFFRKKEITIMDVYTICANFKNSLSVLLAESDQFERGVYLEMTEIIDRNFRGVLQEYIRKNHDRILEQVYVVPELFQLDEQEEVVAQPLETETNEMQERALEVELQTYGEEVLENDLNDLVELEEEIDAKAVLIAVGTSDHDVIAVFSESLIRYGSILDNYPLFRNLGVNIRRLGEAFASDFKNVMDDQKRFRSLSVVMESFVHDLIFWRKQLFETGVSDPNVFDASIISSIDSLIRVLSGGQEEEHEDDELELF